MLQLEILKNYRFMIDIRRCLVFTKFTENVSSLCFCWKKFVFWISDDLLLILFQTLTLFAITTQLLKGTAYRLFSCAISWHFPPFRKFRLWILLPLFLWALHVNAIPKCLVASPKEECWCTVWQEGKIGLFFFFFLYWNEHCYWKVSALWHVVAGKLA